MSDTTPNLNLIVPETPGNNVNEVFDWENYLRLNMYKIDAMKVLGNFRFINAKEYLDVNNNLNWAGTDGIATDVAGDLTQGVVILFPPETYKVPAAGLVVGTGTGTIGTPAGVALIGMPGAIITVPDTTTNDNLILLDVVDVENVSVSGLQFVGRADSDSNDAGIGIRLKGVTAAAVQENQLTNFGTGIFVDDNAGAPSNKITVKDNILTGCTNISIDCDLVEGCIIDSNTIFGVDSGDVLSDNALGHGIRVKPGPDTSEPHSYTITNNTVTKTRRNSIEVLDNTGNCNIAISENYLAQPGQFSDPALQVTKATRGSGIYSVYSGGTAGSGRLSISNNHVFSPLSHGILVTGAASLITSGNTVLMETNDSWHGVAISNTDGADITNNKITLLVPGDGTFQTETRKSIFITACPQSNVSYNSMIGGGGCLLVEDSDNVRVIGNYASNIGWSNLDSPILINGIDTATCNNAIVMGNRVELDSATHGIQIIGGHPYAQSPIVIGNAAEVSVDNTDIAYSAYYDRVFGNYPDAEGTTDTLQTPGFAVKSTGQIYVGRYPERRFFNPGQFLVTATSDVTIGLDDQATNKLPSVIFANGASGYAYIIVDFANFDDDGASGIRLEPWISLTDNGTGNIGLDIDYQFIVRAADGVGATKNQAFTSLPYTHTCGTQDVVYGVSYVEIPNAAAAAGKPILVIRIKRQADAYAGTVYMHGLWVTWKAKRPTDGYGVGVTS